MRAVNLIPAEQRGGASVGAGRSEGAAYAVLGLAAAFAVMAVLYGLADHQISTRRAQVSKLAAQSQRAQSAAAQLAPYTSFVALRQQRTQAVETLVDSRFDWAHAMHEFGRVLPSNAEITSLTGTIGSPTTTASTPAASAAASASAVASVTPPGSVPTFTITGCATTQPAVAETLNRLRLIDGVSTVTLQSSTKGAGSAAAASSAGGGGCLSTEPAFSITITFQPLPTPSAATSSTKVVAATSSSSTGSAPSGSTSAGALR